MSKNGTLLINMSNSSLSLQSFNVASKAPMFQRWPYYIRRRFPVMLNNKTRKAWCWMLLRLSKINHTPYVLPHTRCRHIALQEYRGIAQGWWLRVLKFLRPSRPTPWKGWNRIDDRSRFYLFKKISYFSLTSPLKIMSAFGMDLPFPIIATSHHAVPRRCREGQCRRY